MQSQNKDVVRNGLNLSNLRLQLSWQDFVEWFTQCKTVYQAVSVIRSLPHLSIHITDLEKFMFLLLIAQPPLAAVELVQKTAFRMAGEKFLENDQCINNLFGEMRYSGHETVIQADGSGMIGLLEEILALTRPWKPPYGAERFAKANARFNRFLACIYAMAIDYKLRSDEAQCYMGEQTNYLFRPHQDQIRMMVIQRDMADLILQFKDAAAIDAIVARIRSYQEPTSAVPKLFEDIVSSQKARALLYKRNVLSHPDLCKLIRVLDRLIFKKDVKEFQVN